MDVELERDILGRITGVVAARLIVQLPVHSEVAGARSICGAELGFHCERFGIDYPPILSTIDEVRSHALPQHWANAAVLPAFPSWQRLFERRF